MSHYRSTRRILLSLPEHVVEQLDQAAEVFNMCRLDVIRRSLTRDLSFVLDHELPQAAQLKDKMGTKHREWLGKTWKR